ncbi:MAG: putative lipid II flippase FtsW [Paenibacillaceae bacterium]
MNPLRRGTPDFMLLIMTFALIAFGLLMVYSASSMSASLYYNDSLHYIKRQAIAVALGLVLMLFFMNLHYSKLKKWSVPLFLLVLILLSLVPFIGVDAKGARSWFAFGPLNLQPAEFAKLSLIIYLSALIHKKGERFYEFKKGLLPTLIIISLYCGLIMLQPDFGSTIILGLIAAMVILVGGANLKHFFSLSICGIFLASLVVLIPYLRDQNSFRSDRITAFLNPWADPLVSGYHITQSLMAFGHGGISGAGFGQSIQKLGFLPAPHNDFIFAIIGEELGFIGSTLFLLFYLLFLWRGILIALRCKDSFGSLVGVGIMGMIGIQALINLGGVTNTIPLTGVTLPFISYGGSSILVLMASIGIVLGLSREQNKDESDPS